MYAFGSGTTEGVPFHIAMGYYPQVLVQFTDRDLRPSLDFSAFTIIQDGYNEQHQVYQIFITVDASEANLDTLRVLQAQYPQVNIHSKKPSHDDKDSKIGIVHLVSHLPRRP